MKTALQIGTLLLLMASQAVARPDPYDAAQRAYGNLEYERVIPLLRRALGQKPGLGREAKIYALMALVHVVYGRQRQARQAFIRVLERTPDYELPPNSSPKIIAAVRSAREEIAKRPPPPDAEPIEIGPPAPVDEGSVPPEATQPDSSPVEITSGFDPGQGATEEMDEAVYEQWWFWTILATTAAAGGFGAWYLLRPKTPDSDFGPFPLSPP